MTTLPHFNTLMVRREQDVLFATLNQPKNRNALSPEMVEELTQVMALIEQDVSVRALVMRGSQGFFCAGGNIGGFQNTLKAAQQDGAKQSIASRNRTFGVFMERLTALPVPVLAAVEGAAMGGGMGLACAADFVLALREARFALSETTLGVIAAQIAPAVMRRLGARVTRRLGLSGERVSGDLAVSLGVVDAFAEDSNTLDILEAAWLTQICRCEPAANRRFKPLVTRYEQEGVDLVLDEAAQLFADCLRDGGAEGMLAFREKRAANWCVKFDERTVRLAHAMPSEATDLSHRELS